jgi:hypothetical protein
VLHLDQLPRMAIGSASTSAPESLEDPILSEHGTAGSSATSVQVAPFEFPKSPFRDLEYCSSRPAAPAAGLLASVIALYAFLVILFILGGAVAGCAAVGLGVREVRLTTLQLVALGWVLVFFAVVEGYLGFHRSWAPATARRCILAGFAATMPCSAASVSTALLAPVFAMGFFFASTRRLAVSYLLVTFVIGVVIAVKQCPEPWHMIIDCGVAVGLGLGTISFVYYFCRAMRSGVLPRDVDEMRENRAIDACGGTGIQPLMNRA